MTSSFTGTPSARRRRSSRRRSGRRVRSRRLSSVIWWGRRASTSSPSSSTWTAWGSRSASRTSESCGRNRVLADQTSPDEPYNYCMSSEYADPDIELMLRFQKGDEPAFEELVRKHTRGVLNLVYRYVGD